MRISDWSSDVCSSDLLVSAAFNPLDRIDPHGLDLADDCMTLADALVHDAPGEAGDAHWNEEAKALIAGILLHIVTTEPPATRTLETLRDRLTLAIGTASCRERVCP